MICKNILFIVGALSVFALATGCSNDTVGTTQAPLVASCADELNDVENEWVCPESLPVECEDGVGDPETIYFVPIMHDLPDSCDDIELTLENGENRAGPFAVQPEPHEIVVTAEVSNGSDEPTIVLCESSLTVQDTQPPQARKDAL
ncbi:MAG: hypothetical protein JRG93_21645, partial [Deltaproteobacteria bacterium]|nr:hypothetical protein [Deltaproteobacteria bacterium]